MVFIQRLSRPFVETIATRGRPDVDSGVRVRRQCVELVGETPDGLNPWLFYPFFVPKRQRRDSFTALPIGATTYQPREERRSVSRTARPEAFLAEECRQNERQIAKRSHEAKR